MVIKICLVYLETFGITDTHRRNCERSQYTITYEAFDEVYRFDNADLANLERNFNALQFEPTVANGDIAILKRVG